MPKLIKDGALEDNGWTLLELDSQHTAEALPKGKVLVSLDYWNTHQSQIAERPETVGVVLQSTETADQIQGHIETIPVIAINFPAFADGRGFSTARLLRERFDYTGEIRAIGAPIRDQLSYLVRAGFNAFELPEHYDPAEALASLKVFSESYQTSVEQPVPLFRRRG